MENTIQDKKTISMRFQELNNLEKTSFFFGLFVLFLLSWIPFIIGYFSLLGRPLELTINIIILVLALTAFIMSILSSKNNKNAFTITGLISSLIAIFVVSWFMIVYQYIIYL